jgi:putative transposase
MRTNILKDETCHIYLRGVDKQNIFRDTSDYKRFANLLKYCNRNERKSFSDFIRGSKQYIKKVMEEDREDYVNTIIRTLMPNHFHLLVTCLEEGYVGKYMQRVLDSYTKYFNTKYNRKGHLFEQKYEYRRITNDHDLQNMIDYIFNNPAKLLDENYNHKKYIMETYFISEEQKEFVKNYPYTFKGNVFNVYKKLYNLNY